MSHKIKGNSTAFLFFKEHCCRENKRQNKTDYKDIRFSVQCGEMWRAMTEDSKRKFKMMAECDKKRYLAEKKILKKQLKTNLPKKPKSALYIYKESITSDGEASASLGRPLQNAAEQYNKLTDEEKQKFIDLSEEESRRYKREKRRNENRRREDEKR